MSELAAPGRASRVAVHVVISLVCLFVAIPLLWMLITAFQPADRIGDLMVNPLALTGRNIIDAFNLEPVAHWLLNSIVIAAGITIGKLLISIPAAYAFACLRFRGRTALFALTVGTMIVPDVVTIIPNYVLMAKLHWLNTYQGVIVPMLAFTAFYVFLLRQAMLTIPPGLLDAARIDGAGSLRTLVHIVVPTIRPSIAVVSALAFLSAWNIYLWPLLVLNRSEAQTLPVGIEHFAAGAGSAGQWGPLMVVGVLSVLPPLLVFVFAQKAIIGTLVDSGIKE